MSRHRVGNWITATLALAVAGVTAGAAAAAEPERAPDLTINFARTQWDRSVWSPLRLPHQQKPSELVQRDESVGTEEFSHEETKQQLDNAVLMFDPGATEAELQVVFTIGPQKGTAPGFALFPTVEGNELRTAIGVFVADYTMAVWRATKDVEAGKTAYEHLARLNRTNEAGPKHTFTCHYSKKRRSIRMRVDDSDEVEVRLRDGEVNSRIALWGCHGVCDFFELKLWRK